MPKETHLNGQRDLYACQKRPTSNTLVCGYRYSLLSTSKVICIHSTQRLVGSLKLQVSCAKESIKRRYFIHSTPNLRPIPSYAPMGWLRLVGWLKYQGAMILQLWFSPVNFTLFYRALLQERPIIESMLLSKATPYDFFSIRYTI